MVRLRDVDATKNIGTETRVKSLNKRAKIYRPGITKATHKCLRLLVNLSLDSTGRISSVLTPGLRTGKARGREQKLILGDTQRVLSDAHCGQMIQANQTKGGLCFVRTRGECQYN